MTGQRRRGTDQSTSSQGPALIPNYKITTVRTLDFLIAFLGDDIGAYPF